MPVNTAALKTFAPAMRRQLLEAVGRKLDLLLHSQTPDTLSTYAKQIAELRQQATENREQLLERVAYTWFNRLCALRYLDARGWHPFGCKVLMPAGEGETQPELLKLMRAGSLPAGLKGHTNESRLHGLLDGKIPTAIAGADPQGEVYRELVLATCRFYHKLLPNLFEGLDDASELLLPDDLLSDGSIAGGFRSQISDGDCDDVEIIGWLYQFYISEKKDQVIGKVVKSEDIPAATQLFTPNWIVKYMVQNSLGAQWLATYPASALKGQMEYYIEPAEQTDEVKAQLAAITPEALNPAELTLIDPACGSGHILVEAYELFKAIYLERGYQQREIPQLILEKNLFGLDIDERATQLTSFALMMKGRCDDRRLFERGIQLNVMALVNSDGLDVEGLANAINLADHGLKLADLVELKQLFEDATTFGSLIQVPDGLAEKLPALRRMSELKGKDMLVAEGLKCLEPLVRQTELLAVDYDDVVANPPYVGSKYHIPILKKFLKERYDGYDKDLFSAFIDRGLAFSKKNGRLGFMSPFVWMFISSHEQLRARLLDRETITSLVQLEYSGFEGATVPICTFALQKSHVAGEKGCFIRLSDFPGSNIQAARTIEAIQNRGCGWFFEAAQDDFGEIPGSPIAYWMSNSVKRAYRTGKALGKISSPRKGCSTSDNSRFLRFWAEVSLKSVGIGLVEYSNDFRWIPYNKGGGFLKWYGHNSYLIDWKDKGMAIRVIPTAVIANESHFFEAGLTWGTITSRYFSIRWFDEGFIFDNGGCCVFGASALRLYLMALMNSAVFPHVIGSINPTLNFQSGDVSKFPVIINEGNKSNIDKSAESLLAISRVDWNAFETSWGFQSLPILSVSTDVSSTLESRYNAWIANNKQTIAEMKRLEEENNRLFIDIYGFQDELTPEVPIEQITLTVNPAYRYGGNLSEDELWNRFRQDSIKEFLSYATGCMMGRYSLDHPGLILADSRDNQAAHLAAYEEKVGKSISEVQFKPDPDAILPILDSEWFEDDIVARTREFLKVTFPESSVAENLRFIEDSLGKDLRKYFCTDFYKDHLQTYKKRPIYWLVQSRTGPAKGGFALADRHISCETIMRQLMGWLVRDEVATQPA